MNNTECTILNNLISINNFDKCLIDGLLKSEITSRFPSRKDGAYYLNKFQNHIRVSHNIHSLKEYCKTYLNVNWPKCPTTGKEVGYIVSGKGLILSTFAKGGINKTNCPNFRKGCEKLSKERMGAGNPMFGAVPWNNGLTKETNESVKRVSEKRMGWNPSESTRAKFREVRRLSPLKARHTTPHSEETKNKCRKATARRWAEGAFNRVTSIEKKTQEFLASILLNSKFVFQHQIDYFTVDFAFPDKKVAIECQGSFFHVDPRLYPNGPICAIQRRNFGRDRAKRKWVVDKMGWTVIELWETEINDGSFKEYLRCELQRLGLLNPLA